MLAVNGLNISPTTFPDKTSSIRFEPYCKDYHIDWLYDGDHECILLWYLVHHIRANVGEDTHISLWMPYIPNARMDRVKSDDEIFTLKWFAEFINSMNFTRVIVHDPHSSVATALINHIEVVPARDNILSTLDILNDEMGQNVLICYPDEGSAKRYSDSLGMEYVFCIKRRDWRTGEIERLELTSPEKVKGRNVLIVDDICSRGGTFTFTSKELKAAGADNIFLYITHCEDTIFKGDILTDGQISHIFTTHSIFRGSSDKITVL